MHFVGDTWADLWHVGGWVDLPPFPAVLVPHGEGVGNLAYDDGFIMCDSEPIPSLPDHWPAGLAYSAADVPLVACASAPPYFAFKTNRWRVESIPGPAGSGGIDIETDALGRVVIIYSTQESGLWCAMGTDVVGTRESPEPQASSRKLEPTILSGSSGAKRLASCVVFDAMGRRVLNPRSGVLFIREPSAVRKVVIPR